LLPYKAFHVLDSGLLTTTRIARSNFEDPDGNPYYVAGTSRAHAGKALMVLLTALPLEG